MKLEGFFFFANVLIFFFFPLFFSSFSFIKFKKKLAINEDIVPKKTKDLIYKTIFEFLEFRKEYQQVFVEVGLLGVLTNLLLTFLEDTETWKIQQIQKLFEKSDSYSTENLLSFSQTVEVSSLNGNPSLLARLPHFEKFIECLILLLKGNQENLSTFHETFFFFFFFFFKKFFFFFLFFFFFFFFFSKIYPSSSQFFFF